MLLDEPAAGLDLGGREDLVGRLGLLAADPAGPTLVLVTHHVEEIPPDFTHVLLMRAGRVVGAGPVEELLDSAWLTATFGLPLVVERRRDRWSAQALQAPGIARPSSSVSWSRGPGQTEDLDGVTLGDA
jgi:iron complex transport system ATP-binding protein